MTYCIKAKFSVGNFYYRTSLKLINQIEILANYMKSEKQITEI